jgi:lipopolysaccharide transport system permease protein
MHTNDKWEWEIKPDEKWYRLQLGVLFEHKDLIISFFRKELLSGYQQSVIGVFWIVLQPILTTLFYFIVFSRIVKVSTDNIPPVLFYMSGSILWSFFSDCLTGTMYSFVYNAHIYNKVYFPRLVVPLSTMLNHSLRFCIQLGLFLVVLVAYHFTGVHFTPTVWVLALPLYFLQVSAFSLGSGLLLSVMVARYRDVEHIMNFLLRLVMFVTPVVYPASLVPQQFKALFWLNPITPAIEGFRSAFFGSAAPPIGYVWLSTCTAVVMLAIGVVAFKRREVKVMDTI